MENIPHTEEMNSTVYNATRALTLKQASLLWNESLEASSCYMLATLVLPCYEQVDIKLQFSERLFKHLTDPSTDFR